MNQHKVKPTPQIIVSALFNSVYNAEDEEQMIAATSAMVAAIKTLTISTPPSCSSGNYIEP